MADSGSQTVMAQLAGLVGAPEPALRLLITIFLGYPLALVHRRFLHGRAPIVQHLFFITSGVTLGIFNYGYDFRHCLLTIAVTYGVLRCFQGNKISLMLSFAFNMGYLLAGYYVTGSEGYDILWTMPQCVLTLRLIGLSYDVYDSFHVPRNEVGSDGAKCILAKMPNIFEMFGFCLFPSSFLVGPQYPMLRYLKFVHNEFEVGTPESRASPPESTSYAMRTFGLGCMYLTFYQIGSEIFADNYLLTDEYYTSHFVKKMLFLGFWGRITLYKYISCWLLTEGSCALYGLTYNGRDANNEIQWTGCQNVKLSVFENCTQFNHYIQSFNCNTNQWVAQYIYKRLKFLGNRNISQLAALTFLALWHGLHSGYYMTFFGEFMVMFFEKDLDSLLKKYPAFRHNVQGRALHLLLRLYTFVFMGFCLVPFVFLTYDKYMIVYGNIHYCGFVFFGPWLLIYKPIVRRLLNMSETPCSGPVRGGVAGGISPTEGTNASLNATKSAPGAISGRPISPHSHPAEHNPVKIIQQISETSNDIEAKEQELISCDLTTEPEVPVDEIVVGGADKKTD